jgi:2-(1,2-epoxy-1,2-dihydrophenyl)acetyl-CoA isomerase
MSVGTLAGEHPETTTVAGDAPVLVCRADGVVTVTLNQPRRKNAVTSQGWLGLRDAFSSIRLGEDRVVVVTGAGEDFCAGADLSALSGENHSLAAMAVVNEACLALHRIPVPAIARIDGVAVGAGMNLALACDFVIASSRARFSEIFIKRGLSVDFGGSWVLPRLVGLHKAKQLVLLGDILSAQQAHELGIVGQVVAPGELDAAVSEVVVRLAANPPIAASLSKQMLNDSFDVSLQQALDTEGRNQCINLALEDAREARDAFLEKRQPVFHGR